MAVVAAEAVAVAGDPAVESSPEEASPAGEVKYCRGPPEAAEAEREVADCLGAPVAVAGAVDDHHLLRNRSRAKDGPASGDLGSCSER